LLGSVAERLKAPVLKTGDSKSIIFKAGLKKPAASAEQTLSLDKRRKTREDNSKEKR